MAKRFIATELWDEDWFLEMPNEYKLFWYYILSNCDHAGLYKVNLRSFSSLLEVKVSSAIALTHFNFGKQRIRVISESLWLIEDFFVFQYGTTFNPNNKLHDSVEKLYTRQKIKITSIRGLQDLKDRVKDKDKEKDKGIRRIYSEKIRGVEIKGNKVYFQDGSFQDLGESQLMELERGSLKAREVFKGNSY